MASDPIVNNYIVTKFQRTGSGSYEAWRDDRAAVGRARGGLGCFMVPPPKIHLKFSLEAFAFKLVQFGQKEKKRRSTERNLV